MELNARSGDGYAEKAHLPLIRLRMAVYKRDKREVFKLISEITEFPTASALLKRLMPAVLFKIGDLTASGEFERAFDLADVIHTLPDTLITPNRDMNSYWNTFVVPYQSKWNSTLFDEFRDEFLKS